MIEQSVDSVIAQLPNSPIIITADHGTNEEYVQRLPHLWSPVTVQGPAPIKLHQSGMMGNALTVVRTPYVLYWEHDWQLCGPVEWEGMVKLLERREFNSIKLHAGPRISPYHEYLMEDRLLYQHDDAARTIYDHHVGGSPLGVIRTRQWSQNPHLARTDWYCDIHHRYLIDRVDFIENIVHMIVSASNWEDFKLGIYNPIGNDMLRVRHLDGAGTKD